VINTSIFITRFSQEHRKSCFASDGSKLEVQRMQMQKAFMIKVLRLEGWQKPIKQWTIRLLNKVRFHRTWIYVPRRMFCVVLIIFLIKEVKIK
jgi:hypothetical protein